MNLGGHTVTFRAKTVVSGRLGATGGGDTDTQVAGCYMQPVTVSEVFTDTDVETELWRCLAPPVDAALSIDTKGELIFNGDTFEIVGVKPFSDFSGAVDHVTVDCRKQEG